MRKNILIGTDNGGRRITFEIELREKEKGLEFAMSHMIKHTNANDCISCGQGCDSALREVNKWHVPEEKARRMVKVWKQYHLNGMNAGCEHQTGPGWIPKRINGTGEWTNHKYPSEHPEGFLMKPCPVCGYEYGSAWLFRTIPQEIIEEIESW